MPTLLRRPRAVRLNVHTAPNSTWHHAEKPRRPSMANSCGHGEHMRPWETQPCSLCLAYGECSPKVEMLVKLESKYELTCIECCRSYNANDTTREPSPPQFQPTALASNAPVATKESHTVNRLLGAIAFAERCLHETVVNSVSARQCV